MLNSELVKELSRFDDDCEIHVVVSGDEAAYMEVISLAEDGVGAIEVVVL